MRLSINIGFITNSSFAVHHFPKQLLEYPAVRSFLEVYEISRGFVGPDLDDRANCSTVAMTKDQKQKVGKDRLPYVDLEPEGVLVIYGDEYESVARELAELMRQAAEAMGTPCTTDGYP